MDERQARVGFAALSQETRLRIVRLLVEAGPDGLASGAIADAVGVSASNVSFHLKDLEGSGLIAARRVARSIIYAADYRALRGLVEFLMKDCCAGHPEICAPAAGETGCGPAKAREHA